MPRRNPRQNQLPLNLDHPVGLVLAEAPPPPPIPQPPPTAIDSPAAESVAAMPTLALPARPPKLPHHDATRSRAIAGAVKALTKVQGYGGLSWWQILPRWLECATAAMLAQHSLSARDLLLTEMLHGTIQAKGWEAIARARKWADLYYQAAQQHEAAYMKAIEGLRPEVLQLFTEALGHVALAASKTWDDALSGIYQELAMHAGKQHMGQYFTPGALCRFNAHVIATGFADEGWTAEQPCKVYDPACGAGSMMLAFACELSEIAPGAIENGRVAFIMADIDPTCVLMTKLNATLHSIWHCTHVLEGNSLSAEHERDLALLARQMGWDHAAAN